MCLLLNKYTVYADYSCPSPTPATPARSPCTSCTSAATSYPREHATYGTSRSVIISSFFSSQGDLACSMAYPPNLHQINKPVNGVLWPGFKWYLYVARSSMFPMVLIFLSLSNKKADNIISPPMKNRSFRLYKNNWQGQTSQLDFIFCNPTPRSIL